MAYKVELSLNFVATASATSKWIEEKWSYQSALEFQKKLLVVILAISINPKIGKPTAKRKNIPSMFVTKHNRVYYRFSKNTITILERLRLSKIPNSINSINFFATDCYLVSGSKNKLLQHDPYKKIRRC